MQLNAVKHVKIGPKRRGDKKLPVEFISVYGTMDAHFKFQVESAKSHIENNRKITKTGAWPSEIKPLHTNVRICETSITDHRQTTTSNGTAMKHPSISAVQDPVGLKFGTRMTGSF